MQQFQHFKFNPLQNLGSSDTQRHSSNWVEFGAGALFGVGLCFIGRYVYEYFNHREFDPTSWPMGHLISFMHRPSPERANDYSNYEEDKKDETYSQPTSITEQTQPNDDEGFIYSNSDDERADVPDNAPDACPGVYSENAGFSESCEGCPNQRLCASGDAKRPDPVLVESLQALNNIKHKILVLSGKGGVGKSTVSSQISWGLQKRGFEIGLLDVDICGPSIPRMTRTLGSEVHLSGQGWSPVYVEENFAVMSIGFLLPDEDDAVIWRGPKKNAMIKQFLTDVEWGKMDFLIVDTPPGTSDEHLSIVTFLKETGIDGAIIVTTPQEMSLQDVRKEINFCKKVNIPVLGIIENMANSIFSPNTGGAQKMSSKMRVPYMGPLTLDETILKATEMGVGLEDISTTSKAYYELKYIIDKILDGLNEPLYPLNEQ